MPQEMNIQLDSSCRGVTDEVGNTYRTDKRGDVVVPNHIADQMQASGAARPARRQYGGIDLPYKNKTKLPE